MTDLPDTEGNVRQASTPLPAVRQALRTVNRLLLYQEVCADTIGQAFVSLLTQALAAESDGPGAAPQLPRAYGRLFSLLAGEAELRHEPLAGDAWQNHLLDRLLADENPFSLKAQQVAPAKMGTALLAAARRDLRDLQTLFACSEPLLTLLREAFVGEEWVGWDQLRSLADDEQRPPVQEHRTQPSSASQALKDALTRASDWGSLLEAVAAYYAGNGTGIFGKYRAFHWVRQAERLPDGSQVEAGQLRGIPFPDPVQLTHLIGYDEERALLLRNTEHFIAGHPANNVLLYGDRGTGKSSTIKALLTAYGDRGLRLVEVAKQHLDDFPQLAALLRGRRERFIIFIDDLSFEENESHYKDLKAILEGSLEARPENVLLYATSNRRHLIKERFSDRPAPGDDEVHAWDSVQEKLSLSDRFGIAITFSTPDQNKYLAIVQGLAEQRNLAIAPETLRRRALQWSQWHNANSGRTARQFVDYLTGELQQVLQRGGSDGVI